MRPIYSQAILCLIAFPTVVPAADILTNDGKKTSGEIRTITDTDLVFSDNRTIAVADINAIDIAPLNQLRNPNRSFWHVMLVDGSLLRPDRVRIKADVAELEFQIPNSEKPHLVKIPVSFISHALKEANVAANIEMWGKLLAKRGKRDMVVFRKGNDFDGGEGTIGNGSESGDSIEFVPVAGQPTNLRLTRLSGFVYYRPPSGIVKPSLCRVNDSDGNILNGSAVSFRDGVVRVTTVSGAIIDYAGWDELRKLDFAIGKLLYLSDAVPSFEEQDSSLERLAKPFKNRNLSNEPIRLGGKTYAKGLTLLARTVLVYPNTNDYSEFRTVVGVDDSVELETNAKLTIDLDGKIVFSEVIRRSDPPKPLTFNLTGVKMVRIVVQANLLNLGNQLTLADAKFLKP